MAAIMTNTEFVKKLKEVATIYKTLYVMGCFGAPLVGANVTRYCGNHSYNKQSARKKMIKAAANQTPPVYGFDCVNLIKGLLWGWNGNQNKTYGGATYCKNGVPDASANGMIAKCTNLSKDFSKIEIGEAVWLDGHIGVYIGDGLAIESTPKWDNGVQITAVANIGKKTGYNARKWTKHGKLPYISYVSEKAKETPKETEKDGIAIGDVVEFDGTKHYTSSYKTAIGKKCKAGKAKVTGIKTGRAHPYHLVAISGGGSTVNGWVNADDIVNIDGEYKPKIGDKVKLVADAKVYGKKYKFASWVYKCTLYVREVDGSRIVVSTVKKGATTGAVDKKYIYKV